MKIDRIETFFVPPRWLFVRVETDDGAVGWGEASLEGHAEAVAGAFEAIRDRNCEHARQVMYDHLLGSRERLFERRRPEPAAV